MLTNVGYYIRIESEKTENLNSLTERGKNNLMMVKIFLGCINIYKHNEQDCRMG